MYSFSLLCSFFIGCIFGLTVPFVLLKLLIRKSLLGVKKRIRERDESDPENVRRCVEDYNNQKKKEYKLEQQKLAAEAPAKKSVPPVKNKKLSFELLNTQEVVKEGKLQWSWNDNEFFLSQADCKLGFNSFAMLILEESGITVCSLFSLFFVEYLFYHQNKETRNWSNE